MAAFLAGVFHPAMVHLRANAIGRTALTAFHVQPGLALCDGHVPCHRLSYHAFGLLLPLTSQALAVSTPSILPLKNSVSSLLLHRAQIASFPLRLGSNVPT